MDSPLATERRPQARQLVALLVIGVATAQALGLTMKMPTQLEANDISRWCTVWALVERGTYAIDECPWQAKTQDKVLKPDKLEPPGPGASALRRLEYALAPASWKEGEPTERFYSSKPPLLPTLIAGLLYPFRQATGVKLDKVVPQERNERWVQKPVEGQPGKTVFVKEKPKEPVQWPVYVFYYKPVILLLNVIPMLAYLILYARLLDRYAPDDWAWFVSLFAAAWATPLYVFDQTLNNHTVAAYSAFFAIYPLVRIWGEGSRSPWHFAAAGFFGAFCACNELPAALFGLLLFGLLLYRFPSPTLLYFVPAAAVPCLAFLTTQFLAFGQFKPVYEEFGTKSYEYYGSYWNTPLEMDYLNKHPESYPVYLFHMTFGHHGIFSLTPIFLFAIYGALRQALGRPGGAKPEGWHEDEVTGGPAGEGRRGRLGAVAWLTLILTVVMLAFYTWNPKARNYGGSTQGLRWLFWVIPFWMVVLPFGLGPSAQRPWLRRLSLVALLVSAFTVGYALRSPWSHPWLLDLLEHLNLYTLQR